MKRAGEWDLPDSDQYFASFATTGFQIDHLRAAYPFVSKWDVAVDVGAHIGFWARELADRFAMVHVFEPAADTFACLESNLRGRDNVVLRNAAVGARAGNCTINDDPKRGGNSGARFVGGGGQCPMVAMDDLGLPACDLLKVDVEGYEHEVLSGAVNTIERFRPVIVMETDKRFARARYGVPDDTAERKLIAMGYRVAAHHRPDKVFVSKK